MSLIVRIRLLDAPLERDEGEHAYMAQTMLAGNPPWKLAYNEKLPGTDAFYAVSMAVFGQTAVAIRLGLLIVNTATVLLVALLGVQLFGTRAGLAAGACYGVLSFSQGVLGTVAHSTHLVVFFAAVATLLLLRAGVRPAWLFCSGLSFGLAFLMKQPGVSFAIFGAIYAAWRCWRRQKRVSDGLKGLAAFGIGAVFPYALLCLALWKAGVFPRFWYWTVTLAHAHMNQPESLGPYEYLKFSLPEVIRANSGIWLLAGVGLCFGFWYRATRRGCIFTALLLCFSSLAVCAGGNFSAHYFIMLLLPVALAGGAWVAAAEEFVSRAPGSRASGLVRNLPALCVAVACFISIAVQRTYLFSMSPGEFSRSSYGLNPFPEAVVIGDYIRGHSSGDARVAVIGSEAEIYFYSHRQAATGYLFTYGLMEEHGYAAAGQLEMSNEIEASRPQYIVYVVAPTSWLIRPLSSPAIFEWTGNYLELNYEGVGVAEIRNDAPTKYTWGPAVAHLGRRSGLSYYLLLYRRKSAG